MEKKVLTSQNLIKLILIMFFGCINIFQSLCTLYITNHFFLFCCLFVYGDKALILYRSSTFTRVHHAIMCRSFIWFLFYNMLTSSEWMQSLERRYGNLNSLHCNVLEIYLVPRFRMWSSNTCMLRTGIFNGYVIDNVHL